MSAVREIIETVAFALLIFFLIQAVWRNFRVEGASMEPNIHDGQYLIVNRVVYATGFPTGLLRRTIGRTEVGNKLLDHIYHAPRRGDVIVFIPPNSPTRDYIKRVIGIPGDTVEIRRGRVLVNGQALVEPYSAPADSSFGPQRVGWGELFVLGDNRGSSSDSRYFGLLPQQNVIGQAWLAYWPPRTWGVIRHYDLGAQLQGSR
jgi:signal peptidase I